jgi:hypothetical protein
VQCGVAHRIDIATRSAAWLIAYRDAQCGVAHRIDIDMQRFCVGLSE